MIHKTTLRAAFAAALVSAGTLLGAPAWANPAILIDVESGKVLAHEEAFRRWYPASLTKLMTAYVAFRAIEAGELSLTSPVRVTANAASEPPSKMGYRPGSVMTLDNALKMMLVKSANDIATAIGENVAGSEPDFIRLMNQEAKRIGMTDTRFANANGLHDPDQYTTARDIGLLAATIRREFPQHGGYFGIEALSFGKTVQKTFNTLIGRFDGADGMKTGFICPSGFNLIASATRDGRTLVAVVLGAMSPADRADRAADLLGDGFARPTATAPTLATLPPYGNMQAEPTDMRPQVCSTSARAERADDRGDDGQIVLRSRFAKEREGEPVAVAVGLGGATGPEGPPIVEYADVPTPTPRPDYTPPSGPSAAAAPRTTTN